MFVQSKILLEAKGCSKSFLGVKALNRVDFDLYEREVHYCVVGENGAGKSTFIKVLSGALQPDECTIKIAGREYLNLNPALAHQLESDIPDIMQQAALCIWYNAPAGYQFPF